MNDDLKSEVLIIGAGNVGLSTAAALAIMHPKMSIVIGDRDQALIETWQYTTDDKLPGRADQSAEEILWELQQYGRVHFVSFAKADPTKPPPKTKPYMIQAENLAAVVICIDLPAGKDGKQDASNLSDLPPLLNVLQSQMPHPLVIRSTITHSALQTFAAELTVLDIMTNKMKPMNSEDTVLMPEFFPQGTDLAHHMHCDYLNLKTKRVFGSGSTYNKKQVMKLFQGYPENSISTTQHSAMLGKLGLNGLLVAKLTSNNILHAMIDDSPLSLDKSGHESLQTILSTDERIGQGFLTPAMAGFGGVCFDKDVRLLESWCREQNEPVMADYWKSVLAVNDRLLERTVDSLMVELEKNTSIVKLAFAGLGYKLGSTDTRGSRILELVRKLATLCEEKPSLAQVKLLLYDPIISGDKLRKVFGQSVPSCVVLCGSLADLCAANHIMIQSGQREMERQLEAQGCSLSTY
ncbi:hypothetical protein BCR37DRAFT_376817 [Protomyces lactucae-debilis]|uniref:UDP-glucose/GDP-mannose dehydrogenase dimerisation domain-containing protein n=1 Tax=Protomyces lactucae-debilis TaxID=2754530 RepID=A0A1Y2FRP2_PROLT|nr:uncharacterized protein BCR37DRAFT_376817 [Protomyces lactucae-debilis]ORY86257.1 hypothetical protein BCR37DRAFT_376817 [Protomyces lactucae-debilis]